MKTFIAAASFLPDLGTVRSGLTPVLTIKVQRWTPPRPAGPGAEPGADRPSSSRRTHHAAARSVLPMTVGLNRDLEPARRLQNSSSGAGC